MVEIKALRGMKDSLPEEAEACRYVEEITTELFRRHGFAEIRLPLLERTELFSRSIGEGSDIIGKEMYTFTDPGGRSISLRPEGTASVVRAYVEHNLHRKGLLMKFYYLGSMFRHERPQAGRYRQHTQIGVEALGSSHPALDAEIISLPLFLFHSLGLKEMKAELNTVGCFQCRPRYKKMLKDFLAQKIESMCSDCRSRYHTHPLRMFDCKKEGCREILSSAPPLSEYVCSSCQEHLAQVKMYLEDLDCSYSINSRLVRGFDYYTKTAFEVISTQLGAQNAVAGGGRYDHLVEDMGGPSTPAVGFSFGLERLLLALGEERAEIRPRKEPLVYIVCLDEVVRREGFRLSHQLRKEKITTEIDYQERSSKAQMREANRLGAKWAIILAGKEMEKGKAILKDMETGNQEEVEPERLAELLKAKN